MSEAKIGFEMRKVHLLLENILPVRQIKDPQKTTYRYKTILSSLKEVGLVEPLVVHPQKDVPEKFLLLNGHLRYFALKELGEKSADCIISNDDECYTYNARISRLPAIQEHRMITKAVNSGASMERIATSLNMPYRVVLAATRLLTGIHDEAVELLKDKNIAPRAIRLLKRVNGVRQIEIAELMVATNNFFTGYAEALVLGTPKDQQVKPDEPKEKKGISAEDIAKMEREMESLERDLKSVSENYTDNMFNLTCARSYIKKLLENAKVVRFLNTNHPEIYSEFETIVAAETV